jgi:hypothetical protein
LKAPGDQSSFREAVYKSNVHLTTLTPEYNFRFRYGGFAGKRIKVLHGRTESPEALERQLNADERRRVYDLRDVHVTAESSRRGDGDGGESR